MSKFDEDLSKSCYRLVRILPAPKKDWLIDSFQNLMTLVMAYSISCIEEKNFKMQKLSSKHSNRKTLCYYFFV